MILKNKYLNIDVIRFIPILNNPLIPGCSRTVEYKNPSAVRNPGSSHFVLNILWIFKLAVILFLNNFPVLITQFVRKYPFTGP